ncbi:hypothetical protein GCM10010218_34580 [Streptomyces mashuensis]|uniref:Secreted protein n=1 Tax=Streptomyces mashuensis TaxID=33904 RepID=A0A919EDQ5_9ACTN|nr:hypothetical protein GCM10010218_34580 [Streptomyces mashuensis]
MLALAGVTAVAATVTAALWRGGTTPQQPPPDAPVTQVAPGGPDDVARHWTPERVREAQENMRHGGDPEG